MRGQINLDLVHGKVAIAFAPEGKTTLLTREISLSDAFNFGLLMDSDRPEQALNLETNVGVSLQIENRPYDIAWLTMRSEDEGNVVMLVDGDNISRLGQCFWKFARAGHRATGTSLYQTRFECCVSEFYRDDEDE